MAEKVINLIDLIPAELVQNISILIRNEDTKDLNIVSYESIKQDIIDSSGIPSVLVKSVNSKQPDSLGNIDINYQDVGAYSELYTSENFLRLDGQNINSDLTVRGFKIKELGKAVDPTDAVNLGQVEVIATGLGYVKTINSIGVDSSNNVALTAADLDATPLSVFQGHTHTTSDITDLDLTSFLIKNSLGGIDLIGNGYVMNLNPSYLKVSPNQTAPSILFSTLTSSYLAVDSNDNSISGSIYPADGILRTRDISSTSGEQMFYELDIRNKTLTRQRNYSEDNLFSFDNAPDTTITTKKDLKDFFSRIKGNSSDCGSIKFIYADHANGIPINITKNFLWCDGSVKVRSDNDGLVGTFIDWAFDKPTLRTQFDIPADKSSMKLPDLRNKHIVGSGDLNPIYSDISSKSVDFTGEIKKEYTLAIDAKTGLQSTSIVATKPLASGITWLVINDYNASNNILPNRDDSNFSAFNFPQVVNNNNFHRIQFTASDGQSLNIRANIQDHNHTASLTFSKLELDKNTSLIDTINRVPAFALFPVLDINVNSLVYYSGDNSTIEIGDISGLQNALDSKANVSSLSNYITEDVVRASYLQRGENKNTYLRLIDENANSISEYYNGYINLFNFSNPNSIKNFNLNHYKITMNDSLGDQSFDLNIKTGLTWSGIDEDDSKRKFSRLSLKNSTLYSEVDGLIPVYKDSSEDLIVTKKYMPKVYKRQYKSLNGTLSGGSTNYLFNLVSETTTIPYDNQLSWYWSTTNPLSKAVVEVITPPRVLKSHRVRVRFIRNSGNTLLECTLRRASDNSYVTGMGATVSDNDFKSASFEFSTFTNFETDPFVTGGYYIDVVNLTSQPFNYSSLQIDIETTEYPVQY